MPSKIDTLIDALIDESTKGGRRDFASALRAALDAHVIETLDAAEAKITDLEASVAELEAKLTEAKVEADALTKAMLEPRPERVAKAPKRQSIGVVPGGTLVLGNAPLFDVAWKHASNSRGAFVIDILGDRADFFCQREKSRRREVLPDGTHRIHVGNAHEAGIIVDAARKVVKAEKLNTTLRPHNLIASQHRAEDAVRGTVAAVASLAKGLTAGVIGAPNGVEMLVEDDRTVVLRIL